MPEKQKQEKKEGLAKILLRRIAILKDFILSGIKLLFSQPCWKDRKVREILLLSLLLNAFLWVYLTKNKIESDFPVILHYSPLFGVDFLGNYAKVYLLPLTGLIILLLNSLLCHFLYAKQKLAAYFLAFNILTVQTFLLFAGYLIVKVNS